MKLCHRFSYQVRPVSPYCFELTVKKPAGWSLFTPFEIYENEILWSALHLDKMLLGIKLQSLGHTNNPLLRVEVFTRRHSTAAQKEAHKERLNDLLGLNDDLTPFYDIARNDPILKHAIKDLYGMHDTFSNSLFARATLAILLQMTGIKRSNQMMNCVVTHYGQNAEFDGQSIHVWPTYERVAKLTPTRLARTCKLGYRAKLLVKLARVMTKTGGPTVTELREPENSREAVEMVKKEGFRRWGQWSWMAFFYVVQDLERLSRKLHTTLRLE